jgi:hypothetical protein
MNGAEPGISLFMGEQAINGVQPTGVQCLIVIDKGDEILLASMNSGIARHRNVGGMSFEPSHWAGTVDRFLSDDATGAALVAVVDNVDANAIRWDCGFLGCDATQGRSEQVRTLESANDYRKRGVSAHEMTSVFSAAGFLTLAR